MSFKKKRKMPAVRGKKTTRGRGSLVGRKSRATATNAPDASEHNALRANLIENAIARDNPVASTSAGSNLGSIVLAPGDGPWNGGHQERENRIQNYSPLSSLTSLAGTPDPAKVSKIARDIIPSFDGKNMSVKMFVEHCRAAASMVGPLEMPYLTMLIRTRIAGDARVHIQDRINMKLEEILKTLEQIYSPQEDSSQLLQELTNVKRNTNETIPEYGARVNQLLNKLLTQIIENTPIEKAIGICEGYRIMVIGNFLRGLDKDIYSQLREKEINNLESAIALANQADLQWKSWNRVHNISGQQTRFPEIGESSERNFNSRKRVAYVHKEQEYDKRDHNSRESNVQCYGCKEYGHYKRSCPLGNTNEKDRETSGCSYCFMSNHISKNCRVKERHNKERQTLKRKNEQNLNSKRGRRNEGSATLKESSSSNAQSFDSNPAKN